MDCTIKQIFFYFFYELKYIQGAPIVDPEHKCPPGAGAKVLGDPFNCNISLVCIDGTLSTTVNCEKEKPVSFPCFKLIVLIKKLISAFFLKTKKLSNLC